MENEKKVEEEKRKWSYQPFLWALLGICVIDFIFLVSDLQRYPEMFLTSLLMANVLALVIGVFIGSPDRFVLRWKGIVLELQKTQDQQQLLLNQLSTEP